MNPSQDALSLVKASEGLRLQAYQDTGGVWTIGYGHTAGVNAGDVKAPGVTALDLMMILPRGRTSWVARARPAGVPVHSTTTS